MWTMDNGHGGGNMSKGKTVDYMVLSECQYQQIIVSNKQIKKGSIKITT